MPASSRAPGWSISRIDNQTDHDDTLIAATSDAGMAMLMTSHEDANGVMQMDTVMDGFAVPSHAERILASAGDHVMLSGRHGHVQEGRHHHRRADLRDRRRRSP